MTWTELNDSVPMVKWDEQLVPLEGTLSLKRFDVGKKKSTIYELETVNGVVGVWGTAVLDRKLEKVLQGTRIRLTYLGKVKDGASGNSYHDFKVEVDK